MFTTESQYLGIVQYGTYNLKTARREADGEVMIGMATGGSPLAMYRHVVLLFYLVYVNYNDILVFITSCYT
jgi:6-phosphogluconolactonase/glucosamine-6-phosphate isomerase/deaminase